MNPMFYFLLALTAALAVTANAGGPVLDVDGDPIFHGSYYVIPVIPGNPAGDGLTLAPRGNTQCPLYVVVQKSSDRGIPVKFSNWRPRVGFVPESEDLNIDMNMTTTCFQSAYWWATPSDHSSTWFVEAGPKPESGDDLSSSFFQIKEIGEFLNVYKFAFCPNGNDCTDVGIVDEDGLRHLALSSTPILVVFMKATETETSSRTMSII